MPVASNILIWNEHVGFVKINEGSGDNLLPEDEAEGYVDYIMIDLITYDGYDFVEEDGSQCLLTEMYQDKFKSATEVIDYLIEACFIPDVDYMILHAE